MLTDAEPDLTAFAPFPREHWPKIWSNNPIERLGREIKRRADVVQVFPDRQSVTRLIGAVLLEQHEEWQYGERRYLSETSLRPPPSTTTSTPYPTTTPSPSTPNPIYTTPKDLTGASGTSPLHSPDHGLTRP